MKRRFTAALLALAIVLGLVPLAVAEESKPVDPDLGAIEPIEDGDKYKLGEPEEDKDKKTIRVTPEVLWWSENEDHRYPTWEAGMHIVSPAITKDKAEKAEYRCDSDTKDVPFNGKWIEPPRGSGAEKNYVMNAWGGLNPFSISKCYLEGKKSIDYVWHFTWNKEEKQLVDYIMHIDPRNLTLMKDGRESYPSDCTMSVDDEEFVTPVDTKPGEANAPLTASPASAKEIQKAKEIVVKAVAPAYVDKNWIVFQHTPKGEKVNKDGISSHSEFVIEEYIGVNKEGIAYQDIDGKVKMKRQDEFGIVKSAKPELDKRYYIEFKAPLDALKIENGEIKNPKLEWRVDWDKDYQIVMDTKPEIIQPTDERKSLYEAEGFEQTYILDLTGAKDVYKVEFVMNGADSKEVKPRYVIKDSKLVEPAEPTREGYTFEGWYTSGNVNKDAEWHFEKNQVIKATTLYAGWKKKEVPKYKVSFMMNDGTDAEYLSTEVEENTPVTKPGAPTRSGYNFKGWYKEKECENDWIFSYKITKDTILFAKWAEENTSGGGNTGGGNTGGGNTGGGNTGGGNTGGGNTGDDNTGGENKDDCEVTFDLNGAEGVTAPETQIVKKGEKVSKPTDPVWEGHAFGGWYTEAACTTAWDFDNGTVTGSMKLYAKWTDGTGEKPSPDTSKSLPDAIRYVPWSLDLNKYDIFAGGKDYKLTNEPSWMRERKGVIGGVPQSSRTETFTITYTNKDGAEVKEAVKIEVRSASSSNLSDLSDEHWDYRITDPTGNVYGYNGGCHLTSRGDYDEFRDLYLDGDELEQGTDYDVWRGSTVIEIYPRALRRAGYGSHTVALAFQDDDGTLHCVAQNFSIRRNDSSDDDDDYDGSGLRLTINNRKGGTVSNLSNGSITIRPRSGYRIESVLVNGKSVSVPSNGKLTGLRSRDRVEVTFEEITSSTMTPNSVNSIWAPPSGMTGTDGAWLGFRDVPPEAYYYSAVQWAVNNNVTKGKGNRSFQPNGTCTRAEMVTFLWRACGSPEPSGGGKRFTDVPGNAYYTKAVQWAADKSLVKGEGKRRFNPDALVTRGEAVTFLYRSAGSPSAPSAVKFEDVNNGAFYLKPVSWALNNGIADGVSSAYFRPERPCTRAEVMTFLFRRYQQ